MRTKPLLLSLLITTLLGTTGCEIVSSENILSPGIYGAHVVEARDGQAICRTTLSVGGPTGTYIDLAAGDTLLCNGQKMQKQTSFFNQVWYEVALPAQVGSVYRVELRRHEETLSAEMILPEEIRGARVETLSTLRIGGPVSVVWQAAGDAHSTISASLSLSRFSGSPDGNLSSSARLDGAFPESGRLVFDRPQTEILDRQAQPARVAPGPYEASIELVRTRGGTLAGSWRGTAVATQRAWLKFEMK